MKKFLLCCILMPAINFVTAQQARFGFTGGVTLAKVAIKSDGTTFSTSSKPGFTVGAVLDVPVTEHISLLTGINFTQKGSKESEYDDFSGTSYSYSTTLNYLELPLNLLYNTRANAGNFFLGAGPAINIGISGKEKYTENGVSESSKLKFGSGEEADLKRLDLSVNFMAGYEFKNGVTVSLNYNTGITNISASAEGGTARNNYFGFRLGYMLSNKQK